MNEEAFKEGKEGYLILEKTCKAISNNGVWRKNGARDILLFLDMYVQTLLIQLAALDSGTLDTLREFIIRLPSKDILQVASLSQEEMINVGYKHRSFSEGVPLLLKCCVAVDDKDGTQYAQDFMEGLHKLLYAAAAMDGHSDGKELQFITSYLGVLNRFLLARASSKYITPFTENREKGTHCIIANDVNKKNSALENLSSVEASNEGSQDDVESTLEELLKDLDALIGLADVKREVHALVNLIKVRKLRSDFGLKNMDMSFHMVFTGNPGTGKTTVARKIAAILKKLGLLSKGQLIETDRSGLVAGYVGQTSGKVAEVVNSALGGVLFIDEAYALARKGMENDFGREAIDTLVKLMEDHRDDLIVIVAGYTNEMHDFLVSNPGLVSRFNKYFDFPDYTNEELLQILQLRARQQTYELSENAISKVREHLETMTLNERIDFGNARGIRNIFEKIVQEQANRIAEIDDQNVSKEMLAEITEDDVSKALLRD